MKLISCYINNFGKYSSKSFEFNKDLNSFVMENSEGKTTLASFIISMFYGVDSASKKEFSFREHYFPFNGGLFGGNILFSYKQDVYKIERLFEKSKSKHKLDSIKIYKNNIEVDLNLNGKEVGEYFFSLDKDSFMKTLFVSSEDVINDTPESVKMKLTSQFINADTAVSVETAKDKLTSKMSEYKKDRQGKDCLIRKTDDEIKDLNVLKDTVETLQRNLPSKKENLDKLKDKKRSYEEEKDLLHKNELIASSWKNYDDSMLNAKAAKEILDELSSKYQNNMITEDDFKLLKDNLINLKSYKNQVILSFKPENEDELKNLADFFKNRKPDNSKLNEIKGKVDDYEEVIKDISDKQKKISEIEKENPFNNDIPTSSDVELIQSKYQDYKEVETEIINLGLPVVQQAIIPHENNLDQSKKKKNDIILISLIAVFGVILLVGLILFAVELYSAISLTAVGGLGVIITLIFGFLYLNKKITSNNNNLVYPSNILNDPEREKKLSKKEELSTRLKELISKFGYEFTSLSNIESSYGSFIKDYDAYLKNKDKISDIENEISSLESNKETIVSLLDGFFNQYSVSSIKEYSDKYSEVDKNLYRYSTLLNMKQEIEVSNSKQTEQIKKHTEEIEDICSKYKLDTEQVMNDFKSLETDVEKYYSEKKKYDLCISQANKNLKDNNLDLNNRIDSIDLTRKAELDSEISRLNSQITPLEQEIEHDEEEIEKLGEILDKISQKEQDLEKYKAEYDLLVKAKEYLEKAENNVNSKYIDPVKTVYQKYVGKLESFLNSNLILSPKFELRYELAGTERDDRYLSTSYKTMCAFCYRLALTENVFQNDELPFIILDDPFMSLDEQHFEKTNELLNSISSSFQVIYFTCHKSRKLK